MSNDWSTVANALPLGADVSVLSCNQDGLLALEKPEGVFSHPNSSKDVPRSLLAVDYNLEKEAYSWEEKGEKKRAWLVNRLDSATSGVILLALDAELASVVKQQFSTHRVMKIYYAIVRHTPKNLSGTWKDILTKDVYRANRLVKGGQKIPAKTNYNRVKEPTGGFPVSLLKLMPVTGRTHQLRVQCSRHGHPIVGDRTYGQFSFNREVKAETGVKRLLLHSSETSLRYALRGHARKFSARSPLPEAFNTVMRFRPGISLDFNQ
ncbi:MAG: RluA family pseudouridine synthase [Coraliomargaritaceae bacterium]